MHLGRNFIIGSVCKVLALGVQEFHGTRFPLISHMKIHMIQYDSYQLETSKAKDATGIESVEQ